MLQDSWFVEWVGYCSALSLDKCLIKINYGRFLWLLGSFVVSHDIVFDWYAMLRGVFIEQRFFYERWPSVLFGGLVAANFMVNIVVCYSWIRSFNVRSLNSCKCCKVDFVSLLAVEGNCLAVSRVILRTLDKWKCFQCLEKVILWIHLCLAKGEFRYHH